MISFNLTSELRSPWLDALCTISSSTRSVCQLLSPQRRGWIFSMRGDFMKWRTGGEDVKEEWREGKWKNYTHGGHSDPTLPDCLVCRGSLATLLQIKRFSQGTASSWYWTFFPAVRWKPSNAARAFLGPSSIPISLAKSPYHQNVS